MKKFLLAAAFVGLAVSAHAQANPAESMQMGLDMLREALDNSLDTYGINEVDVEALNLKQVVEIINAIQVSDVSADQVRQRIEAVVTRE
jgi:molecular chaperone GrpE (heat shock protein)